MMTSELKNIIENISRARMLEIKTGSNLPVIIDRIAKAKRKEAEAKKGNSEVKSVDLRYLKQTVQNIKQAKKKELFCSDNLERSISAIKQSFRKNWEEEHLPTVELVNSAIKKGLPTPVLTICGKGTMEIRFTRYLAYFFDSSRNHGLKSSLLRAVLREEALKLNIDWSDNCRVYKEYCIGNYKTMSGRSIDCYCDIAIIGHDYAFIIEQKILSGEDPGGLDKGVRQLKRYSIAISNNPEFSNKRVVKIFLSPTGRAGGEVDGWVSLSHEDLIFRATKLLADKELTFTAKENLRRLLIDLSFGPYQKTIETIDEIEKLAEQLLNKGFNLSALIKFRKLVNANRIIINILTEG